MKFIDTTCFLLLLTACTKTVGHPPKTKSSISNNVLSQNCVYSSGSVVSYSLSIQKIISTTCLPCHAKPGSGGINLDSYEDTKALALNELMDVVLYNPGGIQMPPPPQKLLDSCQIKALNLWIQQGCLFN